LRDAEVKLPRNRPFSVIPGLVLALSACASGSQADWQLNRLQRRDGRRAVAGFSP
jgi:hypothetical protein